MSKTHTAIATLSPGHFDAIQVPTRTPGPEEVLIKVEYASMIAFDTYINDLGYNIVPVYPMIFGFNGAGTVVEVGSEVGDLKVGDRVAAFTLGSSERKAMQEYTVQPRYTCTKIPDTLPLSAAATIPDNFATAYNVLFNPIYLGLPTPSSLPASTPPSLADKPIFIYGAGSTTGQYTIQLLHASGYTNVLVTASPTHHPFLRSIGATHTFDYRSPNLAKEIAEVLSSPTNPDGKVDLALDCVSALGTIARVAKVVSSEGKVALLMPIKDGDSVREDTLLKELPEDRNPLPKGTQHVYVRTFLYEQNEYLRENLMPKILPPLLEAGIIQPNKVRLLDELVGMLKERVAAGLDLLRNNLVSGEKVIVKIGGGAN
ncbi:hypothetical protein D9758_009676 [Tetrapyrgos nigripes]|uniref:Enoyl reductase (ER) domain-containing protein n=1 Tax=Tetrapyrgos nigripes TaxID=182062 RepID=A0A8H5FQN2_9AGAR|nr:hypothetical protein D9758_009676 [Tetrapyrgos nigripes]